MNYGSSIRICQNPLCDTELMPIQKKFCSLRCVSVKNNLETMSDVKVGDQCRWCMDSDHKKFCCPKHEKMYSQFRSGLDSELDNKTEHNHTDAQKKAWNDLKNILTGR